MKKMEEKLKYGEGGSPATKTFGGFADNTTMGNRSQAGYLSVQRQRELGQIPASSNNTLSLPQIKGQIDLMSDRMEKEIDREVKLRKDAKQLIINAVRKEPTLDRNVKAWLKTERDNNQPLNEGQVFTH